MRLSVFFCALALAACSLGGAPRQAQAEITVDVNQGAVQPLPIAIPALPGPHGAEIAKVISADLERSGFFRPIDPAAFIEKNLDVNVTPRYADWRMINAQALGYGATNIDADGRLHVLFRVADVYSQSEVLTDARTTTPDNWRRLAHQIADKVYERLTGQKGYFDTRIVFVAESGPKTKRVKRLAIMDQDGANPIFLTNGQEQVLTPRFSMDPKTQLITYMTLGDSKMSVYIFNIDTGRQESLGQIHGQVFAPRLSPDGNKVAFSVERGGNTDIYVMDLRSRTSTRLTADPGIDTSPSFSADGRFIVFNSDRGGSPQLYVMNADGSGVRRISGGGGRYNTPVWSPSGDLIAFTKQQGRQFSIGVMKPDGSDERILSSSYFEEGPTWAPNGRYLMFHREAPGVAPTLWTVDVTGRIERQAPYPGSASDPAWSPLRE